MIKLKIKQLIILVIFLKIFHHKAHQTDRSITAVGIVHVSHSRFATKVAETSKCLLGGLGIPVTI